MVRMARMVPQACPERPPVPDVAIRSPEDRYGRSWTLRVASAVASTLVHVTPRPPMSVVLGYSGPCVTVLSSGDRSGDDPAVPEFDDPVGEVDEHRIVGRDQRGHALAADDRPEQRHDRPSCRGVELT